MKILINKSAKRVLSIALALAMVIGTLVTANTGSNIIADAATDSVSGDTVLYWDGTDEISGYAGGTGTKDDPYIIATASQLYYALHTTTQTYTATENIISGGVDTGEDETLNTYYIAGAKSVSEMMHEDYGTPNKRGTGKMVPVYEPYYYKVADGISAIYLNDITGNETKDGIKNMVASGTAKNWDPSLRFAGHLDGNGVTIYGMYCKDGYGFVKLLDGSATIKNFNFDSCYSASSTGESAAIVSTLLGLYVNDSTNVTVANISVRNSYIATTRDITLIDSDSDGLYEHASGVAGIIATQSTCQSLTIANCLFDGQSCERVIGQGSDVNLEMLGGIISGGNTMNNFRLDGCVSLKAPVVDQVYVSGKEVNYNRYDKNQSFSVYIYDCYSTVREQITKNYPDKYEKLKNIESITIRNYEMFDLPRLAWGTNWSLVTVNNRTFPMPMVNKTTGGTIGAYVHRLGADNNTHTSVGPYADSTATNPFGYTLEGSGTKEDPYLIKTDIQLARAIATGGKDLNVKLYYKLANDIDVSSGHWIDQNRIRDYGVFYTYIPFEGELDGDGHSIIGISASDTGDGKSVGLIPVLKGGTVKNLHLRNATVVSAEGYVGAIAGTIEGSATITGCSVENAKLQANSHGDNIYIVGYHDDLSDPDACGRITNSYFIGEIGDAWGTEDKTIYITEHNTEALVTYESADAFKNLILDAQGKIADAYKDVWYIGGADDSAPRFINHVKAMQNIDIIGDGQVDEYSAADLAALRNKLLRKAAYVNTYGDVSRNGTTNISDLAILKRQIVDNYGEITDGFWRNVELSQIEIYYGENDNYDAARKMELYLESIYPNADIIKHVSSSKGTVSGASSNSSKVYLHASDTEETPDGKLEIIVGNIDNHNTYKSNTVATATNTYAVTYDANNQVLWLQGKNFTAVEQAVLDFINGSDYKTSKVFTCGSKVLEDYKKPVTVKLDTNYDGTPDTNKTLYYAWGDEFNDDRINADNWDTNIQASEFTNGVNSLYKNQEVVPVKDLGKVIVVQDGKLSMKRGYDSKLGASNNGSVALNVTPGEFNGYAQDGVNAIDTDGSDKYFSSGKLTTDRGMLFKQGYIEFKGQLPADGHAFPAWWLMGRPQQAATNAGYDDSLYGKVYKLNDKWNGNPGYFAANDLNSYKYQIPSAFFEIDMLEVQQDTRFLQYSTSDAVKAKAGTLTTAVGSYDVRSTVHKWWSNGVYAAADPDTTSDDRLYIADWDNYQNLRGDISHNTFNSTVDGSWIHGLYGGATVLDFGTDKATYAPNSTARNKLQTERKYGFSWYTDGASKFEATLYVYDVDGTTKTLPIASGLSDGKNQIVDSNGNAEKFTIGNDAAAVYSDAKVFNQYMYLLFDNKFYSANAFSSNAIQFTDLLSAAGLTSLEVDYVRVYQLDNERDIVTQDTENFNNNNHFGY